MTGAAPARMAGCSALAILISAFSIVGAASSPAGDATQARERVAYVSVVEAKTLAPVKDIGPDAIAIHEDGARREVLRVTPATSPMPVALVVDNSQAASPTIPDLRKALATFLSTIDGSGPVAIFTVADRPTVLQEYTTSRKELLDAAGRLFHAPSSGATLLDTISDVSRGLAKRESDRAAIVVITGENVEFSNLQYRDVLERLADSGAMMYTIVLANPAGSTATDEARNRATVLDRGPRESGGLRIDVLTSMSFESRLKVFGEMLKSQHRVVYARPESLIPPEKIQISAAKPGLEAYGAPARGQGLK
ncbi:MAG TPA: VWA domain-containing protein [Vicinamibacterales bacterium]|nr:VWA domain-containing protein [Vicinamibacterales bacterium]